MLSTNVKILGLLTFLLVLGACTPEDMAVPATVPPTLTRVMTETETAVAQTPPTATPTISPTPIPTEIQTPTMTPRLTQAPSPTPTPIFFDLPEWIVDPTTNVMLVETVDYGDDSYAVTLFNADNGERFDIHLDGFVSPSWVWRGGDLFIRLYHGIITGPYEELINAKTGTVIVQSPPEWGFLSPDGRYFAQLNRQEDQTPLVKIIDQETSLETELIDPFNGRYRDQTQINWSPDGTLLAVQYIRYNELGTPPDYGLAIYTTSGELFRQYEDKSTLLLWSPNLPYRILYVDTQSYLPCILDVVENQETCLETIVNWSESQNVIVTEFIWSPDGSKVSFIHWNYETYNNGVCYLELATEEVFCPVTPDDLQLDDQMYPYSHSWSPGGRNIALFFNLYGLGSDDGSYTSVAVVNSDGQNFRVLGNVHPTEEIWRPSIPSPSE